MGCEVCKANTRISTACWIRDGCMWPFRRRCCLRLWRKGGPSVLPFAVDGASKMPIVPSAMGCGCS